MHARRCFRFHRHSRSPRLVESRRCYHEPIGIGKVGPESWALRLIVAEVEVPYYFTPTWSISMCDCALSPTCACVTHLCLCPSYLLLTFELIALLHNMSLQHEQTCTQAIGGEANHTSWCRGSCPFSTYIQPPLNLFFTTRHPPIQWSTTQLTLSFEGAPTKDGRLPISQQQSIYIYM